MPHTTDRPATVTIDAEELELLRQLRAGDEHSLPRSSPTGRP
jgi:hypothetical protein